MKYVLVLLVSFLFSCKVEKVKDEKENKECCEALSMLIFEYNIGAGSNYYLNNYAPTVEEKSGIESSADFGYAGYTYHSDTLFYNDLVLWKDACNCKKKIEKK